MTNRFGTLRIDPDSLLHATLYSSASASQSRKTYEKQPPEGETLSLEGCAPSPGLSVTTAQSHMSPDASQRRSAPAGLATLNSRPLVISYIVDMVSVAAFLWLYPRHRPKRVSAQRAVVPNRLLDVLDSYVSCRFCQVFPFRRGRPVFEWQLGDAVSVAF